LAGLLTVMPANAGAATPASRHTATAYFLGIFMAYLRARRLGRWLPEGLHVRQTSQGGCKQFSNYSWESKQLMIPLARIGEKTEEIAPVHPPGKSSLTGYERLFWWHQRRRHETFPSHAALWRWSGNFTAVSTLDISAWRGGRARTERNETAAKSAPQNWLSLSAVRGIVLPVPLSQFLRNR